MNNLNFILLQSEGTGEIATYLIIGIPILIGLILLFRLVGSWMLRINEIISLQKETLEELKKLNSKDFRT